MVLVLSTGLVGFISYVRLRLSAFLFLSHAYDTLFVWYFLFWVFTYFQMIAVVLIGFSILVR